MTMVMVFYFLSTCSIYFTYGDAVKSKKKRLETKGLKDQVENFFVYFSSIGFMFFFIHSKM